jgi:large subunit ribosomal protein L4
MSATVLTVEAARKAKIALIENGKGTQAVHDVVVASRAARRSGSAKTKTKAEVNLSGAKPWRQKGTGRARAGYKSSPIWRGGGVVFGPKPRDYSKKISKSVRKLALRKALSARIADGDVLVVDSFAIKQPKTKQFIAALEAITLEPKVLIVSSSFDDTTRLAARNIQRAVLVTSSGVNTEQLLAFKKVILTAEALAELAKRTSN